MHNHLVVAVYHFRCDYIKLEYKFCKNKNDHIKNYLKKEKIDILLCRKLNADRSVPSRIFRNLGYYCYVNGQKSYNGVT